MIPDGFAKHRRFSGPDIDQTFDPALAEPIGRHRADTPERIDRQLLQKPFDALGGDDGQAIGLLPSGGDFGEELVGRDAGRCRERRSLADVGFDPESHFTPEGQPPRVLGDVEIRLVQRQRFDS